MIRIGILTLPLSNNYGGILQAFALQNYLKEMGYEAVLINLEQPLALRRRLKLWVVKRFIQKYILGDQSPFNLDEWKGRTLCHLSYFRDKYVQPATPILRSTAHLPGMFDCFVVGSDQVWRKQYARKLLYSFFLDFAADSSVRRVAYAASFGVSDWQFTPQETERLALLSKRFHAVSVREDSAVELCEKFLGVGAKHVIDPTMLIKQSRYLALIDAENTQDFDGSLLYFILDIDEPISCAINVLGRDLGMKPFMVYPKSTLATSPLTESIYPPVTDWIKSFARAELVVTDSFHGTVFSIIFNRPFLVLGNAKRGLARFSSLLKLFNLEDRLIHDVKSINANKATEPIDWDQVNSTLSKKRRDAEEFFCLALGVEIA